MKELARSMMNYKIVFNDAPVGMSVVSADKRWIEVNKELCRILGYPKEELVNKVWTEITHPDDLEKCINMWRQADEGLLDNFKLDKRYITKDGNIACVTLRVFSQRRDNGSIDYFIASYIDNTERYLFVRGGKRRNLIRTINDNLPSRIYLLDKEGRKLIANNTDVVESGYNSEEENQKELFPGMRGEENFTENIEILRSGIGVFNRELTIPLTDGVKKTILESKIPLYDDTGNIYGLIGFENDITSSNTIQTKDGRI